MNNAKFTIYVIIDNSKLIIFIREIGVVAREKIVKQKLIIILLFILISVLACSFFSILNFVDSSNDSYYIKNFETYKEDFNNIKNKMLTLSDEYSQNEISPSVKCIPDSMEFFIGETKIELTEEEKGWVKNIKNACGTEALYRIDYKDNRIWFGIDGNIFAFVYCVDAKTPEYMSYPDEYWKWVRKSLGSDWYYFRSKR